jgi:hypothetical protein
VQSGFAGYLDKSGCYAVLPVKVVVSGGKNLRRGLQKGSAGCSVK